MFKDSRLNVPTLTLEMRIQPIVQTMVHEMLMSDSEVTQEIEAAIERAVSSFDWRKQIVENVKREVEQQITRLIKSSFARLSFDEEFSGELRRAIIGRIMAGTF